MWMFSGLHQISARCIRPDPTDVERLRGPMIRPWPFLALLTFSDRSLPSLGLLVRAMDIFLCRFMQNFRLCAASCKNLNLAYRAKWQALSLFQLNGSELNSCFHSEEKFYNLNWDVFPVLRRNWLMNLDRIFLEILYAPECRCVHVLEFRVVNRDKNSFV